MDAAVTKGTLAMHTSTTNQILDDDEPLIGMAAPGRKYGVHPGTLTRWIQSGCRSTTGERVHLEGVRRGSKWFTSWSALTRFFARLSTPAFQAVPATPLPTPTDRRRAVEVAVRELESMGA